ncbi:hypothetical protein LYSHEL_22570 [Lysobacter helvus]|uniref:Uncharacterized protein n=2 Tax=Lysobacteraceae TaxID=32033 RepID=A0ABN6FUW6_9GAMM|nr:MULTISPECIES: hypothetical protein [Lysobacter]BCT93234.1 hypothetical protein LYSCAS_22580 [Lysobacter caseinilyticus]BCT96386.1 hypothetical protein LYSHEL_22570 [Lysobacter helvus]
MRKDRAWVGLGMLLAVQVAAAQSTGSEHAKIAAFLEHSSSQFSDMFQVQGGQPEPPSFEDRLYAWAKAGDDLPALQRKAAGQYDLSPELTQRLLELTIERAVPTREDYNPPALIDKYIALAHDFPRDDTVLVEAGRTIDEGHYGDCDVASLERLLAGRPDADRARVLLYDTIGCDPLLTTRTTLRAADSGPFLDLAERASGLEGEMLQLAALRVGDAKAHADPSVSEARRTKLRALRIGEELEAGRTDEALALLPESPATQPALTAAMDDDLRLALAAAHALRGDATRARAWRASVAPAPAPANEEDYQRRQREGDAYLAGMLDRLLDAPAREDFPFLVQHFRVDPATGDAYYRTWEAVFARLARAQGYPGLVEAAFLRDPADEKREAIANCHRCAPELLGEIDHVAATNPVADKTITNAPASALPDAVRARMDAALVATRPIWREQALPVPLRRLHPTATQDHDEARFAGPPQRKAPAWAKRLPEGELVRWQQDGARIVAFTASQSLDPTGEISAGGYWVSVSHDNGAHFDGPLYTGLRMFAPYAVLPDSKLPMLDGDRLQLEVAVRAVDNEHIMLPPVSLPFLEQRDDAYVEATLDDLARDTDADGLTDLAEWAMLLDAARADTDDDGLPDGRDPLPQVSATTHARGADAMARVLQEILGDRLGAIVTTNATDASPGRTFALGAGTDRYNAARTLFMQAPPAWFAGLSFDGRIVVLDPAQREQLSKVRGKTFATEIEVFETSRDGSQAIVKWTSGWTGGTYLLTRERNGWKLDTLTQWIT